MTILEKRAILDNFCGGSDCDSCELRFAHNWQHKHSEGCLCISTSPESDLDKALEIIGYKTEIAKPSTIKDSGIRREFESGAVRDIQEGKGRCDLLPLDVVAEVLDPIYRAVFSQIDAFQHSGDVRYLITAIKWFASSYFDEEYTMILEVSKHFEDGAKKYGESNWQKGIPVNCYLDSAIRHYLKYRRGDNDEDHARAFVWNLMCCIWEVDCRDCD
jgi:hypothetical protein